MIHQLVRSPLVVGLVGAVSLAPALWFGLRTVPDDHGDQVVPISTVRELPVGNTLTQQVNGRRVSLAVSSQAAAPTGQGSLAQVPTNAPTTLTVSLTDSTGQPVSLPSPPVIRGWRLGDAAETSLQATTATSAAPAVAARADDHAHDHTATSPSTAGQASIAGDTSSAGEPQAPVEIALDRAERLMVNLAGGAVAGVASSSGAHAHLGAAEPGAGLAATMSGAAYRWMVKVTDQADEVLSSPDGRWTAVVDKDRGLVDVVDVLLRRKVGSVEIGGRLAQIVYSPAGSLWALDGERHRLVAIDPATARIQSDLTVPDVDRVAATADGRWVLGLRNAGATTLVDTANGKQARGPVLSGDVRSASATTGSRLVVAHGDGTLSLLSIGDDGIVMVSGSVRAGHAADLVAVAPGGSKAVVLDKMGSRATVVDLERQVPTGSAQTAQDPAQVVFLEGFAVVRNAGNPAVTWVDLADPSKSNDVPLGAHPADHLAVSEDGTGVLASSPTDGNVYHLHAMMGRPMVMGQDRLVAGADRVLEVAASVGEVGPGRYQLHTLFEQAGRYRLDVQVGEGQLAQFELVVAEPEKAALRAIPEKPLDEAKVGERVAVRFRGYIDASDVQVLAYVNTAGGSTRQERLNARWDGRAYEVAIVPEVAGTWRLFLVSEERGLKPTEGMAAQIVVS